MTQIWQFILWNIRDIGKLIKSGMNASNVFAIAIGYQLGNIVWDMHKTGEYTGIMIVTLPITLLLIPVYWWLQVRWDQFKTEQQHLLDILSE